MSSMLAFVLGGEGAMAGTTLYLRSLPEALVREAKATAARRGITLAALVSEALQRAVGSEVGRGQLTKGKGTVQGLTESMRWFEENRERLLRRHRDQYVAVDRNQVIDHDRDFDVLARRIFAKLGTRPVFIPKVTAAERVVRIPSPRVAET